MIYTILIFSILFESAFSNIVPKNTILLPLFLLTALTVLYPYFRNKNFNFIIVCFICGLIYDITFTGSIFINTLSFSLSGGLIIILYNYINYSLYNSILLNILVLIFYRIISYILLCIVDFINFSEMDLIKCIYSSLIINILYGIILFIISSLLAKLFNIKRI